METLKRSRNALSAATLHKKLPEVDLTTIYRNLELFVKDGVVKKLNLGDEEAVYEYAEEGHHHAICVGCDRVIHFSVPEDKIRELIDIKDFKVGSIEITVRGNCRH